MLLDIFDKGLIFLHNLNNFLMMFVVIGFGFQLVKNAVLSVVGH